MKIKPTISDFCFGIITAIIAVIVIALGVWLCYCFDNKDSKDDNAIWFLMLLFYVIVMPVIGVITMLVLDRFTDRPYRPIDISELERVEWRVLADDNRLYTLQARIAAQYIWHTFYQNMSWEAILKYKEFKINESIKFNNKNRFIEIPAEEADLRAIERVNNDIVL